MVYSVVGKSFIFLSNHSKFSFASKTSEGDSCTSATQAVSLFPIVLALPALRKFSVKLCAIRATKPSNDTNLPKSLRICQRRSITSCAMSSASVSVAPTLLPALIAQRRSRGTICANASSFIYVLSTHTYITHYRAPFKPRLISFNKKIRKCLS